MLNKIGITIATTLSLLHFTLGFNFGPSHHHFSHESTVYASPVEDPLDPWTELSAPVAETNTTSLFDWDINLTAPLRIVNYTGI